jgi:protein-tyrosine phosphatase
VIDLHSHLLPGVDDGSRSVVQSVEVLKALGDQGYTDLCLTPHLQASALEGGVPSAHDGAFAALQAAHRTAPRLHRGAEVMLDRGLTRAGAANPAFRLAGGRYMLVEFPRLVAAEAATNALRGAVEAGVVPLLAHPERYSVCSPALVARWRALGVVTQVDATTALQPSRRGDRARALLAHGFADLVAADNHGDQRSMLGFREHLAAMGEGAAADLLTAGNPQAVLEDRALAPVPPVTITLPLRERLRRLFRGEE